MGLHLKGQLVPVGIGLFGGPIGIERSIGDCGQGPGMDGEHVDKATAGCCYLFGECASGRAVAALMRRKIFEEHMLRTGQRGFK